jgi:UDP-N-acetylmuramoyl-tripeptide--D-alanyl-D-alanine ligase
MKSKTLAEVVRLTGGTLVQGDPAVTVKRLHTDTRTITEGDCFVALRGDRFDGHTFVPQAREQGAVAAVVSNRVPEAPGDLGLIQVPNTLEALQHFAGTYRSLLPVRTIGVTGSSGKTSTKELIAAVLRVRYKTKATEGNLNNHIGVPLTLIRLDEEDEYAVIEMGMNHPGEIAPLAAMAAPIIGVISSIGPAHIEFFSGQAAIAEEKAALLAALPSHGVAILNSDDEWSRVAAQRTTARVVWVGSAPDATFQADDLRITDAGLEFKLRQGDETAPVRLPFYNRVMAANALLAAAVGVECGLTLAEIAHGLADVQVLGARMQVVKARGASIVNDSYNANPASMRAALAALNEFPGATRKLAVLGSMGELGRHASDLHAGIGEFSGRQGLALLIAVGPHAEAYWSGALAAGMTPGHVLLALDAKEATTLLRDRLQPGDVVLVKGSHFMGLEKLVADIAQEGAA